MKWVSWSIPVLLMALCLVIFSQNSTFSLANGNGLAKGKPPEGKLTMIGNVGDFIPGEVDDPVHDPALIKDKNTYYVFSTGILSEENPGGIYVRKSEGSLEGPWQAIGEIPLPQWTLEYNVHHLWAPQVVKHADTFYLYYAASSFGTNRSAIGVARTKTPGDLNSWEDLGPVLTSEPGDMYNAIDPHVFKDGEKWWIAFGSHWGGIQLQELKNMTEPIGDIYTIASRPGVPHNPIEAPTIFKKGDYYYLLTSWDSCCRGIDSTYKIAVGRSENVTGPYVDQEGRRLAEGGGTILLESRGNQIGPGGQDVLKDFGRYYMIHHYYDGDADGVIRMQIRSMEWENGWPYVSE
ncbi:arabinan endo-1,5-alpha-L-arabinosidase [Halalkalibacterium halodurans]|nr:arabinan endo-1,5-alpha-L-arabinosidase [Halalkalibacterium halodurans]MDY7220685.1 arabinan endo-1,5-alpha-L-arabinosidase [Halalkalibacterium halodurans]MDY7239924.1 arabinan endo-1,5-alpha-L-arabinosidase [Halalkalibacterium halodurans]